MFLLAGHIPAKGECVIHPSGWKLEAVDSDPRRIIRVRLHAPEALKRAKPQRDGADGATAEGRDSTVAEADRGLGLRELPGPGQIAVDHEDEVLRGKDEAARERRIAHQLASCGPFSPASNSSGIMKISRW